MFDPLEFRSQFPIFHKEQNKDLIYFDSAASAQKPQCVIDSYADVLSNNYANVHRGIYRMANRVTDLFEEGRQSVAKFLNVAENEVIFTKSATEAFNLLSHSYFELLEDGDEIIISIMEHHANIVPWYILSKRKNIKIHWCDIDEDGLLDLTHLENLMNSKTRIVSISHMSNILGTINPIEKISTIVHRYQSILIVDGCQAIVHNRVNLQTLGADFYCFSAHKLYGPTGLGILWGKYDLLAKLPPFLGGGEMITSVSKDEVIFADPPFRFEAGTPPISEVCALTAALTWLNSMDLELLHRYEMELYNSLRKEMSDMSEFTIHGDNRSKGPVLSFSHPTIHAHDLAQYLDRYNICVRAGMHCAEPLANRLGVSATLRVSFAPYNQLSEIEKFLKVLKSSIRFFS